MAHSKFNSIDSLRLLIKEIDSYYIKNDTIKPDTIKFNGKIKLHGTNAGVGFNSINGIWCQSRSNIITPEHDNAEFAKFVKNNNDKFLSIIDLIKNKYSIDIDKKSIILFGEWCGDRIQNKVAISTMDRFYALFDVKIVDINNDENNYYINSTFPEIESDYNARIFNLNEFKTFNIEVNFSNLELTQSILTNYIEEIEKQCPFAEHFEVKGPGEGIVFTSYITDKKRLIFKVKGDEHKASKEIKKVEIKTVFTSYDIFIARSVTQNRFHQAMENIYKINPSLKTYNKDPSMKDIKDIVEWVRTDIYKEERDTILENNFNEDQLNKLINKSVYLLFKNELKIFFKS